MKAHDDTAAKAADEPLPKVSKVSSESAIFSSTSSSACEDPVVEECLEMEEPQAETTNSDEVQNTAKECVNCVAMKQENRQLRNRVKTLQGNLAKRKSEQRKYHRKGRLHKPKFLKII